MLKISKGLPSTMNIWECLKIQILLIIKTKLSGDWILTSLEEMSKADMSMKTDKANENSTNVFKICF